MQGPNALRQNRFMDEIEAIEGATLAAVPPQRRVQWQRWLLAFGDGTVGRCQVQQDNAAACSPYAARGFATAWASAYWKKA